MIAPQSLHSQYYSGNFSGNSSKPFKAISEVS
jgi:hypothetical protein